MEKYKGYRIYYKVITKTSRRSVVLPQVSSFSIEYKSKIWVTAHLNSKIFIFRTRKDAESFRLMFRSFSDSYIIVRCIAKNARPMKVMSDSVHSKNIHDFWAKKGCYAITNTLKGTYGAKSIMCLE